MKTIPVFIFLIFFARFSQAQSWQHFFGGSKDEIPYSVIQTSDGGYILAGYTLSFGAGKKDILVVKTDENGKMQWQQVAGGSEDDEAYDIVQNAAGEYYVAGETESYGAGETDFILIKLSVDGNIRWTKTYGGPLEDYASGIVLTAGGEPVMTGETENYGSGGSDVYLLKTDTSGNQLWSKAFGTTGNEEAYSISKVHDGGFILCGQTTGFGTRYGYAVRTNANGDSLWTRAYNVGTLGEKTLFDVTELSGDSAFAFTGEGGTSTYQSIVLVMTNLAGDTTYTNMVFFQSYTYSSGSNIIADADGGFTTYGYYAPYYGYTSMMKFDAEGTKVWQKDFGLLYFDYQGYSGNNRLVHLADGSYVFAGHYYVQGYSSFSNVDFSLVKTDSTGAALMNPYHPAITANGPTSFCDSGSVLLSAPPGYRTYQWKKSSYWADNGNDSTFLATETGSYSCVMTDEDGIYTSQSIPFIITPTPVATISPAGAMNFCVASYDSAMTAAVIAGASYQWNYNGSPITGATTTTYRPLISGSYTLTVSNSCGTSTSPPTVVNTTALPNGQLSPLTGSVEIIQGHTCYSTTLNALKQPGVTYDWYFNGVSFGNNYKSYCTTAGGNYHVIVSNGCGSTASATAVITTNTTNYQITATGPTSGCGVDSVKLYMDYGGVSAWFLNGSQVAGAVDTFMATSTGTYSCEFQFYCSGCMGSQYELGYASINVTINHYPRPYIAASGPLTVCTGTLDLTANPAGATYIWYKNGMQISGATSQIYTATASGRYQCQIYTSTCGIVFTNQLEVVFGLPVGTINVSPATICPGQNASCYNYPGSYYSTYQWLLNGSPVSGATTSYFYSNQPGIYTCEFTNPCGSDTSNADTLVVSSVAPNTLSPSGTFNICPGDSMVLSAPAGGYTYSWRKNGNTISGATHAQYTAKETGIYTAYVSNGSCNVTAAGDTINVTSLAVNNIWESSPLHFCGNDSVLLNANTGSGYTYQWFFNGLPIAAANQSSYDAAASGDYSVQITNSIGCKDTSANTTVAADVISGLSVVAAGPTNLCDGDSVLLSSGTTGTSYQWSYNGNIIAGATNISIVADTSGVYTVEVTNAQACTGSASMAVTINNPPYATMTIQDATCAGNDGTIYLNASSSNDPLTIFWSNGPTGIIYQSGLAPGIYAATITDAIGCVTIISDSVQATSSVPSPTITTSDTILCAGQSQSLYTTNSTTLTFQWQYNGVNIPGATNSSYYADTTGSFACVVSNSCGPGTSNTIQLWYDSLPAVTVNASGTVLCPGDTLSLSVPSVAGYTYTWRHNGIIITGATNSTFEVLAAGNYSCGVNNGCGSVLSDTVHILLGSFITAIISTSDSTVFCQGNDATLTANTGTGITYQWQLDGVDIPGATNSSWAATTGGTYLCIETNGCNFSTSNLITVTVNPLPLIFVTASDTVFCPGDSATLIVNATSINTFQWQHNGTDISGATDSLLTVYAGGSYTCTATNNCGSVTSNSILMTEDSVPVPSINGGPTVHICQGASFIFTTTNVIGYTYEWLLNLQPIAGATSSSYAASVLGRYRVRVTDPYGCSNMSAARLLLVGCLQIPSPPPPPNRFADREDQQELDAVVFPNPSTGFFNLVVSLQAENYSLRIFDIFGRVIEQRTQLSPEEDFRFGENFVPGIYLLEISEKKEHLLLRVIKN